MLNFLTLPLSWLYRIAIWIRHKLFDLKILKSEEFDIPIVCIGNLTVGGTGKTPFTEYAVNHLRDKYNIAVLSRGYKRQTKGFLIAETDSSALKVGDEPKQIKTKFPDIVVAVCEKRVDGIKELRRLHPEINLIILDDAFQHRYVEPWINIVLMDFNRPIYHDSMLPHGNLRDLPSQLKRANIIVVTKCPEDIKPLDIRITGKYLNLYPYQSLYFSSFSNDAPQAVFPNEADSSPAKNDPVIAMAGIANPEPFLNDLKKKYKVEKTLIFEDHHKYKMSNIHKLESMLSDMPESTKIVTTEKDAVKFFGSKKIPKNIQKRMFYIPISVLFMEYSQADFNRQLEKYVEKNQKYSMLHPV